VVFLCVLYLFAKYLILLLAFGGVSLLLLEYGGSLGCRNCGFVRFVRTVCFGAGDSRQHREDSDQKFPIERVEHMASVYGR
jgi:hypothetical protein